MVPLSLAIPLVLVRADKAVFPSARIQFGRTAAISFVSRSIARPTRAGSTTPFVQGIVGRKLPASFRDTLHASMPWGPGDSEKTFVRETFL